MVKYFTFVLMFGTILLVILTHFSWAILNTAVLIMVSMFDIVQKCLALI